MTNVAIYFVTKKNYITFDYMAIKNINLAN